jgi:hypothetical protein
MNEIKLTVELCAEDRARLDNILAAVENSNPLTRAATAITNMAKAAQDAATAEAAQNAPQTVEPEKPNENPPWEKTPATPEPATPAKPEKTVSEEELRSLVQELIAAGKRDAVFGIIQKYAAKVSAVPADKRPEAMAQLQAVKEGKA